MPLLFAFTIFVAAALLFLLEPMVGKMLLPYFGGAPAVWNTCLAFFQAALLAGYGYAHGLTRQRPPRAQLLIHLAVLTLPFLVLPLAVRSDWAPQGGANPTLLLVGILSVAVAVPFVVVAATSPLLQQWLAATRHRHAADPYYLYAASNAGSLLGLIAYPVLVEPHLTLDEQSGLWTVGYALLAALVAGCVVAVRQAGISTPIGDSNPPSADAEPTPAAPTPLMRLRWVALAFVPSSLLLGVTAYLSTDVSPVPLMWVVPLALYLLSFMLAFSRLPAWTWRIFAFALPLLVLAEIYHTFTGHEGENYSLARLASIHLATFFCAAMSCHGELARLRPPPAFLTAYYFWLSLGGVLGGLFNALVAPVVVNSLIEYPLALSLACAFSPLALWCWPRGWKWPDLVLAAILGPATVYILFKPPSAEPVWNIAICLALCTLALGRPLALGLSIATLFAAVAYHDDQIDHIVLRRRDFFGVLAIETDSSGEFYYLLHGRIRHGQQRRSEDALVRGEPSSYYHVTSPIGQVFAAPAPVLRSRPPLAVVGLGVGSLACYGLPGQEVTFYEIDPAIERLARDDRYFTYLRDARAECRVVLGDARLSLAEAPNGHYGLIVVDAFSGDAIPVHLLTHEAIEIYVKKLAPGGVLAFHISNRYVNLVPVLANLATASALVAWEQSDSTVSEEEDAAGKLTSQWVILARSEDDFGPLIEDVRWQVLTPVPELPLWTDHYTSLWGIVEWRGD